jgi:3-hydroxyisobutyrate dehydrogenase-like beta-hydroxyacid dehydrogenase
MNGPVGFIGLGNMGSALASNVVAAGLDVIAYDLAFETAFETAGPERTPEGAETAASLEAIAARAEIVVFSLPDFKATHEVANRLRMATERRTTHVIDTSTIGPNGARLTAAMLAADSIRYLEAPVSGGVSGARARTLTVMCAGEDAAIDFAAPVLAALSDRVIRVDGPRGSAQALKLLNNFLSATALAATSEAMAFGLSAGLDMRTMLDVLNVSSGRSAATQDKFPEHVLTARYASGFANSLMAKDLQLYIAAATEAGTSTRLGWHTADIWQNFADDEPGADFTRIFPYLDGE